MFLPRRRQRRLLLPPGWMALGFLLLLGCLALLTHRRQLLLPNVMQMTIPPLQPSKANSWGVPVYGTIAELNRFRPWHDADFMGTPISDFLATETIKIAIRTINADFSHAGGVRIRFQQQATYGNLVDVLDMMNVENQKKYWFDFRHQPFTLYVITDRRLPFKASSNGGEVFSCGGVFIQHFEKPLPEFTFQQLLNELRQAASTLWQQDWQPSILLLAAISSLSFYRLNCLHRAAR